MAGTAQNMADNIKELAVRVASEFNAQSEKLSTVESTANAAKSKADAALPSTGGVVSGDLTVNGNLTASLTGNASTATKATQDGSGNVIVSTYATKSELDTAKSDAQNYTDTAVANLVNSAPEALNTLGELATAIQENEDVVEALNSAVGNKASKEELGNDSFIGKIEMFYGTLDSTGKHPLVGGVTKTNWQICDGTNGTPDLRDKFVVGAGNAFAKGATGGSSGVTVDKESFEYSMSTKSLGSTTMTLQTGLPSYVALYYIMKIV
jgi:hypothetical protein